MPNIKFNYLYRDSANYKKYDFIIFFNPENIALSDLEILIRSKLIYGEWFHAEEWHLTELFLSSFDFKIDPTWHEFERIELTNDEPNSEFSLNEFREILMAIPQKNIY